MLSRRSKIWKKIVIVVIVIVFCLSGWQLIKRTLEQTWLKDWRTFKKIVKEGMVEDDVKKVIGDPRDVFFTKDGRKGWNYGDCYSNDCYWGRKRVLYFDENKKVVDVISLDEP